ncbi:hypothetical protein BDQ12DRAFT_688195 [Crucibulum laeve]|uniref:Uncharacterized protein n=1 Tax=Crucibulum laeve TaxID=68775 RepID=A0A5C3LU22_9AGAR|nr:hypothetical protein BDQ12DRAFT_688195 [Crucibulum laeve]
MNIVALNSAMALSDNTQAFTGLSESSYPPVHHPFFSNFAGLPSQPSSNTLDFSGFISSPPQPLQFEALYPLAKKLHGQHANGPAAIEIEGSTYPSPPSSEPRENVPLPEDYSYNHRIPSRFFGGILDSPPVMEHEFLKAHTPLSPPPTIPTSTHALPPADHDEVLSLQTHNFSPPSYFFGCQSPGDEIDATNPLLSPLSPDWSTARMHIVHEPTSAENCCLLSGSASSSRSTLDELPEGPSPCRSLFSQSSLPERWEDAMDMQQEKQRNLPQSAPPYPFSSSSPDSITDDVDMGFDDPFFSPPHSPSIRTLSLLDDLDDLDDVMFTSPSSPSRRLCSSLPDDPEPSMPMLSPPCSPGPSVLSLPGAETDDDLLSSSLASSSSTMFGTDDDTVMPYDNHSLLLFDEPPPPRSPSPESFNIDPVILAEHPDPELHGLYEVGRRAQTAERIARQEHHLHEKNKSMQLALEARKTYKREKDRSREVATLLRLKLDKLSSGSSRTPAEEWSTAGSEALSLDELVQHPQPYSSHSHSQSQALSSPPKRTKTAKKANIKSVSQLVANMIFARHEQGQSSIRRAGTPLPPSPLSGRRTMSKSSRRSDAISWSTTGDSSSSMDEEGEANMSSWLDHPPPWNMSVEEDNQDLLSPL